MSIILGFCPKKTKRPKKEICQQWLIIHQPIKVLVAVVAVGWGVVVCITVDVVVGLVEHQQHILVAVVCVTVDVGPVIVVVVVDVAAVALGVQKIQSL